jgi:hypothetical protein
VTYGLWGRSGIRNENNELKIVFSIVYVAGEIKRIMMLLCTAPPECNHTPMVCEK